MSQLIRNNKCGYTVTKRNTKTIMCMTKGVAEKVKQSTVILNHQGRNKTTPEMVTTTSNNFLATTNQTMLVSQSIMEGIMDPFTPFCSAKGYP